MGTHHTPGPWRVKLWMENHPNGDVLAQNGSRICIVSGRKSEIEAVANQQLIAAAPDLYDALRTAVDVIEQLIPEPSARGVADVVLAQARAALSRASGGADRG